jgi:hypothetical protein
MWKWVLKGVLAISSNPAVQAWVKKKARKVIDKIQRNAEDSTAALHEVAGLPPTKAKITKLIRTDKDVLHPGQVAIVDGKAYRVLRLMSSNAQETYYEGVEA